MVDISNILQNIRSPNSIVYVSDSRNASKYLDVPKRNKSNAGWMNWMEGWLRTANKPLNVLGALAVSGSRSDEWAAQVTSACALKPQIICMQGPINDIGQQYPTAGTVVATAFANMKAYIKQINDAGATAMLIWERGAQNFTSTMIGNMNDYNRLMADFVQWGDGDFRGAPNVIVVDPTPSTVVTSSNGTIALKNSVDGTHDNVVAAQLLGYAAAQKLAPFLRERPGHRLLSVNQSKSGLGSRSLLQVAGLPGSVAATGTGNTGNAPTGITTNSCTGGVSVVYSVEATAADADGNTWGQQIKAVVTATSAGTGGFYTALPTAPLSQGSIIRGGWEVDVAGGATALGGVYADLEWFPTTGGFGPLYDMLNSGVGTDPGGYSNFCLEPDPLVLGAYTGTPFTNIAVRFQFSGAGSATIIARKPWAELASR